jgi:hypothetical protein
VAIGVAGADVAGGAAVAAELYSGKTIIPIPLNAAQPLPGVAAAWEALDALVLETAPNDEMVGGLMAGGVAIVVRSAERPGGRWPWEGAAGRWVLHDRVAGPRGAIEPAAYEPVYAWKPGWPASARRQVVLLAVVFCVVAMAATLWRSRKVVLLVLAASAAAAAGFAWWGERQPAAREAVGAVIVTDGRTTQLDLWEYAQALRAGHAGHDWIGATRPMFASSRHMEALGMRLECTAAGRPARFHWDAQPGATMAFVTRSVRPEALQVQAMPAGDHSPLRELVRSSYLSAGGAIDGQAWIGPPAGLTDWRELWPSVLVRL